jgi:hypothetical protein
MYWHKARALNRQNFHVHIHSLWDGLGKSEAPTFFGCVYCVRNDAQGDAALVIAYAYYEYCSTLEPSAFYILVFYFP